MMPEEPERWEKYGFPDPTFYPSYLPFVGLCKALNERLSWYGYQMDLPDYFNGSRDGKTAINYIYEFDTYLALLGISTTGTFLLSARRRGAVRMR